MKSIESYNNICISLDMATGQLERYIDERKRLIRLMDSRKPKEISGQAISDMPTGGRDDTPLNEVVRAIQKLDSHIEIWESQIDFYKARKQDVEDTMTSLEGLQYKVFCMHRMNGYSKWRISEELNYSVSYIEKILAELNGI